MTWLADALGAKSDLELTWILVGLGGQALFMMRFLVQWIASERERRSVVP
ncbi:MAG: lipid-A-disaccharide synthase N-terminal domain-containing protein, partial [Pseudomonadota bacterium]